jgi:1,4-alpha-glucan branching enzyme
VVSLIRRGRSSDDILVGVFNFTPVPRNNYQIGIPRAGRWLELLNSDAPLYGGSGQGNLGGVDAVPVSMHGHLHSVTLTLPPLGALFLKPEPEQRSGK